MQRARLQAQADTRRRIWEPGTAARAPTAIAAATLLRVTHISPINTQFTGGYSAPAQYPTSDPRSSKARTKCPQQHSNHIAHTRAGTSSPQPSRHSLYAAQTSRRTQPKGLHEKKNSQCLLPGTLFIRPFRMHHAIRSGHETLCNNMENMDN